MFVWSPLGSFFLFVILFLGAFTMGSMQAPDFFIKNVSFRSYLPQEIRTLSVKEIKVAGSFDLLGNALEGGVYDTALGTEYSR